MKNILAENMRRFNTKNLNEAFQGEMPPKKENVIQVDGSMRPYRYFGQDIKVSNRGTVSKDVSKSEERRRIYYTMIPVMGEGPGDGIFTLKSLKQFDDRVGAAHVPTMEEFKDIIMPKRSGNVKLGYAWVKLASGEIGLESLDGKGGGSRIDGEEKADNLILITDTLAEPMDGHDDENLNPKPANW
jgi:hypothetical protein